MQNNFTRGLIIGGMLGASVSMMMNPKSNRSRKRMAKNSRSIFRKSGHLIGDIVEMFR